MKILLIEDNPDHVMVTRRILQKKAGTDIDVASDSAQAAGSLSKGTYDLIICDYRLPCSSALEVLHGLKEQGIATPLIVTTSAGNEKVAVELIQEGAYDYITKDEAYEDTLPIVINRALEKHRMLEERSRIEDALRASEEQYRALVENLPAAVYLAPFAAPDTCTYMSAQIETILGFSGEEFSADPALWMSRVHPDDRAMVRDAIMRTCAGKGIVTIDYRMLHKDGRTVWVQDRSRVISAQGTTNAFLHGVMTDITELKKAQSELQDAYVKLRQAQEELIQSSKMAALGQLATGISHELNQPLTGIKGFAQAMLIDMNAAHPFRKDVERIVEQANRMEKIIKNVRFFARKSEFESKELPCVKPLDDALMLLSEQLKLHNIRLIRDIADDLPSIRGDQNELQQAFINLLTNARDAIDILKRPEGGDITIRAHSRDDAVVVRIEDTGCGISKDNLGHIFNPFFTTKSPNGGIGMGLSIVYRIVENHRARIEVESTEGRGTAVTLYFPAVLTQGPEGALQR